jgi:phage terminase large subunit
VVISDLTIWIAQFVGREIRLLDYVEGVGQPRYIDHWTEAGFECGTPIKNTGAGAAMMGVEAVRRIFPRCWFNESTTEAGRDALGYYHERRDENRSVGLGPEKDWSSHCADAFGYLAIAYEEPPVKSSANNRRPSPPRPGSFWAA